MDESTFNEQSISSKDRIVSVWEFVGYILLFCIPIVNIICAIIFACSNNNINRRNFARAYLIIIVIATVLYFVLGMFIFNSANRLTNDAIDSIDKLYYQMENNNAF